MFLRTKLTIVIPKSLWRLGTAPALIRDPSRVPQWSTSLHQSSDFLIRSIAVTPLAPGQLKLCHRLFARARVCVRGFLNPTPDASKVLLTIRQ